VSDRGGSQPALHLPSLDGIRALSFLVVFGSHAVPSSRLPGQFGVTVFFFLSGLLITTLMRAERERAGAVSFEAFYLRRALRILPPFYLVLALATLAALVGLLPGAIGAGATASIALHFANYRVIVHGWEGMPAGTTVYWSLAVEEHFYLLFPALYVASWRWLRDGRAQARLFLGLCAAVLAWRCVLVFVLAAPQVRTFVGTDTRIDSILFGCALAVYGNPALDPTRLSRRTWLWVLCPAGAVLLGGCFALADQVPFRETVRYSLQGIGLWPLFVGAVRYPDAPLFRPLSWRPLQHVGVLSYSLYLLHHVVIEAVGKAAPLGRAGQTALSLLLCLALAEVIWRLVERPCARLRARLSSQPAAAPAAAALDRNGLSGA
jgi:peptidoglycan/LPS O-acetylase OafA/YrhL